MPLWRLSSSCCSKELLAETCSGASAGPSSVQEHTHTHNHNLLQQQKRCWAVALLIKDDTQSPNVTLSSCMCAWVPLGMV